MPVRGDEVEAAVDPVVHNVLPVQAALVTQIPASEENNKIYGTGGSGVTYIPSSDPDPTFLQNCNQCSETGTTFADTKPTGPKVLSLT